MQRKQSPVNQHNAPRGFLAVAHPNGAPCEGCAFRFETLCPNVRGLCGCVPTARKDGQLVIFVKA